jgi:hypothetical protein
MTAPSRIPPDLTPPVPGWLTSEQRIVLWMEAMNACEELLLAGLRREVGPNGDLIAAYRRWQAEHIKEHDRTLFRLMERLGCCENNYGC